MALVNYPSSDEDEESVEPILEPKASTLKHKDNQESEDGASILKRKHDEESEDGASSLPPLPSQFHDLYASTARVSTKDDPSLHGGRTRVTPHVEGNWPTHLYIEWYPGSTEHKWLTKIISRLKDPASSDSESEINSSLTSDLGAPLPLHISLSRPIGFPTEIKDAFVSSLEKIFRLSRVNPFSVSFSGLDWVSNFDKTRWFLVLRIVKHLKSDSLNRVLYISNKVVQQYGQPPLYAKPSDVEERDLVEEALEEHSENKPKRKRKRNAPKPQFNWTGMQDVSEAFHVSIAWTLEKPSFQLLAVTKTVAVDYFKDVKKIAFYVDEVKAKVGNVITNLPLVTNVAEEKSLWGE